MNEQTANATDGVVVYSEDRAKIVDLESHLRASEQTRALMKIAGDDLSTRLSEAETALFNLRGVLLYHVDTTDPVLLDEVFQSRAKSLAAAEAATTALRRALEDIGERSSYPVDPRDAFDEAMQRVRAARSLTGDSA